MNKYKNPIANVNYLHIRIILGEKGYPTIIAWAKQKELHVQTVYKTLSRWAGKNGTPNGLKTIDILEKIKAEL